MKQTIYVAFLRGINVGGNNKVEMKKLKATFEHLGFCNVRTFIASGNIIFQSEETDIHAIMKMIENGVKKDFKLDVPTLVINQKKLGTIVNAIPSSWVNDTNMKCDVLFLWEEVDNKDIIHQLPINPELEDIMYTPGAVIWRIDRDNVTKSKMTKIVGTKLYRNITVRNPNTVRKIWDIVGAYPG